MSRYYLKSMEIGFEVPFLTIKNTKGVPELTNTIVDRYLSWFDIVKVGLKHYQLPNLNKILLFYLVVRVDSAAVDRTRFNNDWVDMKTKITDDIEDYLKANELDYRKFD